MCQDLVFGIGMWLWCVGEVVVFGVYQGEVVGVLQFVVEVFVVFGVVYVEFDVMVVGGQCGDGEVQCIGIVGNDVVWEFFVCGFFDFWCVFGFYQVGGVFGDQVFD